jgi:hypothetical protein
MNHDTQSPEAPATKLLGSARKRWMLLVAGSFALIGIAYGVYWTLALRYVQSTDDAYVSGNVVQITPQISGTVIAIGADDTQFVTAGSFGTSITTTLWERRASLHHAQLGDHITNVDPSTVQALAGMQAGGMSPQQSYASLDRMLDQQAFMLSANDIFYVSALVFVLLIAVVWLARPVKDGRAESATVAAR